MQAAGKWLCPSMYCTGDMTSKALHLPALKVRDGHCCPPRVGWFHTRVANHLIFCSFVLQSWLLSSPLYFIFVLPPLLTLSKGKQLSFSSLSELWKRYLPMEGRTAAPEESCKMHLQDHDQILRCKYSHLPLNRPTIVNANYAVYLSSEYTLRPRISKHLRRLALRKATQGNTKTYLVFTKPRKAWFAWPCVAL